MFVESLVT